MKGMYVKAAVRYSDALDVKGLIPDAGIRRRMSRLMKMGVAAGMECVRLCGKPDAIVTATGYGFLSDTEKLLNQMETQGVDMMSPTPFMQSTFNSIGSNIAILTECNGENMTFADGWRSAGAAIIYSKMLMNYDDINNILLVMGDEMTPTLHNILQRMGVMKHGIQPGEGVTAFMLGTCCPKAIAMMKAIKMADMEVKHPEDLRYPTAVGERIFNTIVDRKSGTMLIPGAQWEFAF